MDSVPRRGGERSHRPTNAAPPRNRFLRLLRLFAANLLGFKTALPGSYPSGGAGGSGRRDNLDGVDFGVLDLGGESDVEGAVLYLNVDGFDVGAQDATGQLDDIEVLELLAFDIEAEDAFADGGDALISLGEVEFHAVLPVREFPMEGAHAVALGAVDRRGLGVSDSDVGTLDRIAAGEAGIGAPDDAGFIGQRRVHAGLDADDFSGVSVGEESVAEEKAGKETNGGDEFHGGWLGVNGHAAAPANQRRATSQSNSGRSLKVYAPLLAFWPRNFERGLSCGDKFLARTALARHQLCWAAPPRAHGGCGLFRTHVSGPLLLLFRRYPLAALVLPTL